MGEGLRLRDLPDLKRQAHNMKCGAAMMGAMELSGAAASLEMAITRVGSRTATQQELEGMEDLLQARCLPPPPLTPHP